MINKAATGSNILFFGFWGFFVVVVVFLLFFFFVNVWLESDFQLVLTDERTGGRADSPVKTKISEMPILW